MQVIDPAPPIPDGADRVAAAEQQVARVETQADRRVLENALDLPRRLDVRARLVLEGRLIAALATAFDGHLHPLRELLPLLGVETQRPADAGLPGPAPAHVASHVGR